MSPVTLLTGANGGLGLDLAACFLKAGHRKIAFHHRSAPDKLVALLKEHDLSPESHLFSADLTHEDEVRLLRESVESKLGPVQSLINLAGASSNGMSWKLGLDEFRKIVDANLTSTFLSCREFIPGMRNAGNGRIVNVSSVVAFTGAAGASHYCAAKAGIAGFTGAIALELASKKITANTIALGYFDRGLIQSVPAEIQAKIKEKIPTQRFGEPKEIFSCLEWLLGDGGAYTTGQVIHINGGLYS